ncbi:MAG: hypothetical protein ACWA40_02005 [Planktomarina sp.]
MRLTSMIFVATFAVAACQPQTPNDYRAVDTGGFNDTEADQAAREAALTGTEVEVAPLDSQDESDAGTETDGAEPTSDTSSISDEQDFDAVASRQTIESDAARIEANRAQYAVIEPTNLPNRQGNVPNIVEYALQTDNPVGVQLYKRFGFNSEDRFLRNCAQYKSPSMAQQDFLARGGPIRDRKGLDPDGDGYACAWDPRPFRVMASPAAAQ